jgi:hypothetical protein
MSVGEFPCMLWTAYAGSCSAKEAFLRRLNLKKIIGDSIVIVILRHPTLTKF